MTSCNNFYNYIKLAQKRYFQYQIVSSLILKQKRNRNDAIEQGKTDINALARFRNIWKITLEISCHDFLKSGVITFKRIHLMQTLASLQFLSRNAAKIIVLLVIAVSRLILQLKSGFLEFIVLQIFNYIICNILIAFGKF